MANQVGSVGIYGTIDNPSTSYRTVGLGTNYIRSIEPFVGTQPTNLTAAGITILTVIRMAQTGTRVGAAIYLSPTATATVVTACT